MKNKANPGYSPKLELIFKNYKPWNLIPEFSINLMLNDKNNKKINLKNLSRKKNSDKKNKDQTWLEKKNTKDDEIT